VLAVDLRPDGVHVKGLAQFGERTATNEVLKGQKRTPLAQVGALPAGQVSYSASVLDLSGSKSAALLLGAFSAADEDAAASQTIGRLLKDLAGYDRGVTLSAGSMLGVGGLEVIESKDATGIVNARLGVLKSLTKTGTFANVPLKEKPAVTERAESVGGVTLHAARIKFDLDRAVSELPEEAREATRASLKRALGGEEIGLWLGTDGKVVLQVTAADWAAAKALGSGYLDRGTALEKDEAFRFTRKQLPDEATMLIVLDAARTAHSLFGLAKEGAGAVPGLPVEPPDLKVPDGKPSYVGIALVLKPEHGRLEVFVPATAAGPIRKVLAPLLEPDN
jgi:hypothetical protein